MRLASLLALLLIALPAAAQDLPPVGQTPYAADFVMRGGGQEIEGRVHQTPGAERREVTLDGQRQIMLLRAEAGEMAMLFPDMKMGMRLPMPRDPNLEAAEAFAAADPQPLGEETVNGEPTTVYAVDDGDMRGRFWVTPDGIVMRSDVTTEDGPFSLELSDVERGPQDPALFEVPAGTEMMDAGQLPGMTE
jgi:hypothetical protein